MRNRFTGIAEELSGSELRDFADLSPVNEIDVAEHAPGFLDEHGPTFRRLAATWEPVLSPAVAAEAVRAFGLRSPRQADLARSPFRLRGATGRVPVSHATRPGRRHVFPPLRCGGIRR